MFGKYNKEVVHLGKTISKLSDMYVMYASIILLRLHFVWRVELNELNDQLGNCVNLGQGFPDFQPAPHIVEHLANVCKPDPALYSFHQYARAYVST